MRKPRPDDLKGHRSWGFCGDASDRAVADRERRVRHSRGSARTAVKFCDPNRQRVADGRPPPRIAPPDPTTSRWDASLKIVLGRARFALVESACARQFVDAVAAHDFEAAEALLDPDVETVTPRGTLRGIAACRQVLQKAGGDEQFAMEQAEPEFEDVEGDVIARTREIARWRETGEVAYERDFALRLTLDDERIVRIVVMPGGALPSQINRGSRAD